MIKWYLFLTHYLSDAVVTCKALEKAETVAYNPLKRRGAKDVALDKIINIKKKQVRLIRINREVMNTLLLVICFELLCLVHNKVEDLKLQL